MATVATVAPVADKTSDVCLEHALHLAAEEALPKKHHDGEEFKVTIYITPKNPHVGAWRVVLEREP